MMSGILKKAFYTLMVLLGLAAMYTILNAGNPQSLLRPLLPDPAHDVNAALGFSVAVFVCGFFVFYTRDRAGFRNLVQMNADTIRACRRDGMNDGQIADEILAAMGSRSGYRHSLAHKKLVYYLSEFE